MNFFSTAPVPIENPKLDVAAQITLENSKFGGEGAFEESLRQFAQPENAKSEVQVKPDAVSADSTEGQRTEGNVSESDSVLVDPGLSRLADSLIAAKPEPADARPVSPRRMVVESAQIQADEMTDQKSALKEATLGRLSRAERGDTRFQKTEVPLESRVERIGKSPAPAAVDRPRDTTVGSPAKLSVETSQVAARVVSQRAVPVANTFETQSVSPSASANPVFDTNHSNPALNKAVASELGQQQADGDELKEKKRAKREAMAEVATAARSGTSSLASAVRPVSLEAAPSVLMQRVIESIEQMTKAVQRNHLQLSVELEGGDQVRVALRLSKNSLKTIIHTESDALRGALREGWDQFQKQIASKGIDAQLPEFSFSESEGQDRERPESEFKQNVREELAIKRAKAELKGEAIDVQKSEDLPVAHEEPEIGLRRYA